MCFFKEFYWDLLEFYWVSLGLTRISRVFIEFECVNTGSYFVFKGFYWDLLGVLLDFNGILWFLLNSPGFFLSFNALHWISSSSTGF